MTLLYINNHLIISLGNHNDLLPNLSDKCQAPSALHSIAIALAFTVLQCGCGYPPQVRGLRFSKGENSTGAIPPITACCLQLRDLGKFNGEKKISRNYVYDVLWV